ncbi:MAG: Uma2 family endonuclease [Bacteroidales bacterium]|nr:Uma2 family endonuclease [Bacteroidales bacterium]
MEITDKIIKSHKFPIYFNKLKKIYEEEQKLRQEFYNKITPSDKAEFINGQIIMHSSAKNKHLLVSNFLSKILHFYVDDFDLGQVYVEKALISLQRNDYEPDLCFFKKEKSEKFTNETLLFPAPDLVVEILSKSTEKNDRGIKFVDYAFNRIPEYWIIDPDKETVEQYILWEKKYELFNKTTNGIIVCKQIDNLKLPARAVFDAKENQEFLKTIIKK